MPNALKSCPKSNNSPNLNATHNINLVSNSILNLSSHCETGKYKQKRGWGWPIFKKNPLFFLPNVWTSLQNLVSQILVRQEQLQTLVFEFKSFKVSFPGFPLIFPFAASGPFGQECPIGWRRFPEYDDTFRKIQF